MVLDSLSMMILDSIQTLSMRKINLFCLVLAFMACSSSMSAQIDIKISPLGLLFGSPDVSVEYLANEQIGLELLGGVDYGVVFGSGAFNRNNRLTKSGARVRLLGKYYFETNKGGDTWYAGIYAGHRWRTITPGENNITSAGSTQATFTSGIHGGYKFVLDSNIVFDLGLGAGRVFSDAISSQNSTSGAVISSFGLDTFIKLEMGYRF